jgi:hypothetical protein
VPQQTTRQTRVRLSIELVRPEVSDDKLGLGNIKCEKVAQLSPKEGTMDSHLYVWVNCSYVGKPRVSVDDKEGFFYFYILN